MTDGELRSTNGRLPVFLFALQKREQKKFALEWIAERERVAVPCWHIHPNVTKQITISGKEGDDAKHYQERAVRLALREVKR